MLPDDPISKTSESAIAMHEAFLSFVNAGFTEDQAMNLLKTLISIAPLASLMNSHE